jgi:imidazolonepropionase-like amidohydrolase
VLAHAHSLTGAWAAVHAGVDGIEHFTCLTDHGVDIPDELLAAVAAAGIAVGPTYGFDPSLLAQLPEPPPPMKALLDRMGVSREEVFMNRRLNAAKLRRHGVRVVSGLDAGVTPLKRHGLVWRSVTDLVTGGYPVEEALVTATSAAAQACGLADVTGSLAAGLDADLLVVDGDLRSDPEALGHPLAVLLRGVPAN